MSSPQKLRILCLHGMVQNGTVFRKKTAALRKKLEKVADLVYVTGPHLIVDPQFTSEEARAAAADEDAPEELKPYGWWQPVATNKTTPEGYYVGFKESVEAVKKILIQQGPFDGVFGFSQGACLAAVMTQLLENRALMPELVPPDFEHGAFRFAIIAAGFKPVTQEATRALFRDKIATPSLHMIGEGDTLVVPERMLALLETFENPVIHRHPGGHFVPTNAASRNDVAAFISKFI